MFEISLIAVGNKMPTWVCEATIEFRKRLSETYKFNFIEIPMERRKNPHDIAQVLEKEAAKIYQSLPKNAYWISLDVQGKQYTSEGLAEHFSKLQHMTSHVCFIIGGPEGLPTRLLNESHEKLSLSSLTLPHPIARIVLLEALYRSWSISHNHPYHKS